MTTSDQGSPPRVACIIPAKDEADLIVETVTAAAAVPGVDVIIVCDDGSSDDTGDRAYAVGARVVRHPKNQGKAAAIKSAVNSLGVLEQEEDRGTPRVLLLLDADLGASAANAGPLVGPVLAGRADLTVGILPAQRTASGGDPGGFGLVMRTAAKGITELTGFVPQAPLSGQRCLTRHAFDLANPLAAGFGIEVGMTIDVLRAGLTLEEIEVDLRHRASGADLAGQLHRARQLRDVTRALTARGLVRAGLKDLRSSGGVSGLFQRLRG